MNEFLEQFLLKSRELVEQGTNDLLALELRPNSKEQLDSLFRALHTLKGGAGIVDFDAMARALHAAEDVLAAARSGARPITSRLVRDCLACLDQVARWLDAIEASGELPAGADAEADGVAAHFVDGGRAPVAAAAETPVLQMATPREAPGALSLAARAVLDAQLLLLAETNPEGAAGRLSSAARVAATVLRRSARPEAAGQVESSLLVAQQNDDPTIVSAAIARAVADDAAPAPASSSDVNPTRQETVARTIRVDAERIDALVDLTGELTVAKNLLGALAKLAQDGENPLASPLRDRHALIERLVGALQRSVLVMRVLPLRHVFQRFPRLVREMAADLGKPCRLVVEGDDTEADKTIVEALYEPLLHVLRNAMDHGVETAPRRAAAGKPATATIRLRGGRQGEHVLIEVEDDGAGVDIAKVRRVAAARAIASAETLAALTEIETINLLFEPGFSTATEVTGLSGRGVGMDAVRTGVERLGGRVSIESRPTAGSIVRFDLPFSVMMTKVMTVDVGGQIFGIPLDAVVETVRVDRGQISPIGTARAFVRRNRTIPVFDLEQLLRHEGRDRQSPQAMLVVVASGAQMSAFEVNGIGERMDVMLKPMGGLLSGMPGISGTTLLGDGNVMLVLDVSALLS